MGGANEKEEPFPNEEEKYSCCISHFLLFLSLLKSLEAGRDGLCCTLSARGNSRPHILLHPDPQSDFQASLSKQPNLKTTSIRNSRLIVEARSRAILNFCSGWQRSRVSVPHLAEDQLHGSLNIWTPIQGNWFCCASRYYLFSPTLNLSTREK